MKGRVKFNAITGDMIDAKTQDGEFFITFADMDSLVGYSPVVPKIIAQKKINHRKSLGVDVYWNADDAIAVLCKQTENGLYKFAISHSSNS